MYLVAVKHYLDEPLEDTVTLDEAYHRMRKRSKANPGLVFYVYHREWGQKEFRKRGFAVDGNARWIAGECKACEASGCGTCKGVGYV